ncbi:MAG: citramalate synthase [Actinomycetota bacterium]|nr:citramalate synthase [Actinomycetota bacterium]MDK1026480.1 citramalate synthase [Actinomycetota bacterium]MDK1038807.1 citramalate synthase [Actinomycetota bacterium]MDK1096288.1 citramalate synthase [Actinomycetota bacterium]MDK1291224.1 citramalate synthase [Actinomycetota bacterium]
MNRTVEIYDTTLRDGTQQVGISLTVRDKLAICSLLDGLGVAYVEGGWPGANPKEDEFFRRVRTEVDFGTAKLVAFGATRRAGVAAEDDPNVQSLLDAGTDTVCLVGKTWDYHVEHALRTSPDEAIAMIGDTVAYFRKQGRDVFFDAEHFFDGYRSNPDFAVAALQAAHDAGASRLVLCDTNGGFLSHEVERIIGSVTERVPDATFGCHFHNDAGLAVGNSLTAVQAGVFQVQGCINGYGERTGNADLCSVIPNLSLKMGIDTIPHDRIERLTTVSHHIAEVVNLTLDPHLPYVGASAFTHKAGLHASAIARRPDAYEHLSPASVGNSTRMVVSELAGRSAVLAKAEASGLDLTPDQAQVVVDKIKEREHAGYQYEAAGGSFELLARQVTGWRQDFFDLESYRVLVENRGGEVVAEATVKVIVKGERIVSTRDGDGPVAAMDRALRAALVDSYPEVDRIKLTDYRVRDLDSSEGASARVRVLTEHADSESTWGSVGVHTNIIDASWSAVADGLIVGLLREQMRGDTV